MPETTAGLPLTEPDLCRQGGSRRRSQPFGDVKESGLG